MFRAIELKPDVLYKYQRGIFEMLLKSKIPSKLITSPLRVDKKPTCGFYTGTNGRIYFHDFATEESLDCIRFAQELWKTTREIAIQRLFQMIEAVPQEEITPKEKNFEYTFIPDDIQKTTYFRNFKISDATLRLYNVFLAKTVYVNGNVLAKSTITDPLFVYLESGKIKTYRPLSKDPLKKWGGNCTSSTIFGLKQLPLKGQICFITSSLKDVMELRELGFNAVALNAETLGTGPNSMNVFKTLLNILTGRFEHVLVFHNNDAPGINYMRKLYEVHRVPYIYIPFGYPKDISDYVKKFGYHKGVIRMKRILSKKFKIHELF